jgi:hypothetical protein
MKQYSSFDELREDCPGICEAIARENNIQYPNATFIIAAVGQYSIGSDDDQSDLIVLFDVGVLNELLYVWGAGYLSDSIPDSRTYIDEYYLMTSVKAWQQLNLVR